MAGHFADRIKSWTFDKKVSSYVAQYTMVRIAQSTLHLTPSKRETLHATHVNELTETNYFESNHIFNVYGY